MSVHTALRLSYEDHAALKKLAKQRGLTIKALLVDGALGRLPEKQLPTEERLNDLEQRLERIEAALYTT